MAKKKSERFIPVKFHFKTASDETRFYIYSIWNPEKNKYYIGISRSPAKRINRQLKNKNELKDDYARAAHGNPKGHKSPFKFGILNADGYPNAFLGCIAEVLYMVHLEKQSIPIYNQNKFGGHPSLQDKRRAFETIVKIIDPSLQGHPSDDDMHELERHIPEIRDYVSKTNTTDIINSETLKILDQAWDDYLTRRKDRGFGRDKSMPNIAFGREYTPLDPIAANDNVTATAIQQNLDFLNEPA
jgi:GIY-YIG catalytic domain